MARRKRIPSVCLGLKYFINLRRHVNCPNSNCPREESTHLIVRYGTAVTDFRGSLGQILDVISQGAYPSQIMAVWGKWGIEQHILWHCYATTGGLEDVGGKLPVL